MDARRLAAAAPLALTLVVAIFGAATSATAQPGSIWSASYWHLWRIEVDGTGLMPLDETPKTRCGSPVWSPDGTQIVYDVTGDGPGYQVAVVRADGTDRRLVGRGSIPCWSPDGRLILCQGRGKNVMNLDGTGSEVLPGPAFGLRWAPRGNRIASMIGYRSLSLFELASGDEYVVSTGANPVYHGYDFSSDGLRICYGSSNAGLCVATIDPQTRTATVDPLVNSGTGFHASWSPDDKRIVFAWQRLPPTDLIQLYIYDVETGDPPQLLPGLDLSHHNVNPEWSPDGKTIVFSRAVPLSHGR